jgi:hypothetical protein
LFNPLLPGLAYRFRFLNQPGIFVLLFHQRRNILFLGIRFDVAGFQLLFSVGANGCVRLDLGVGVLSFVLNGRNLGVYFSNTGAHLFRQQRIEQLEAIPGRIKEAEETRKSNIKAIDDKLAAEEKEVARIIAEANARLEKAKEDAKANKKTIENDYKETLQVIVNDKSEFVKRKANADKWLEEYEANNPEQLDTAEQLKKAEEHNRINALVVDYMAKKKQKEAAEKTARTFEDKLGALAKERETLIATSKLPIAGLSFTDDGLELNGVPFVAGKVSDSQIMEVAAKLIIASNPTVKVFRIARGESLGEKRLQAIIDIAKANGFQGFIEEVKRGQTDLVVEEYTENE